MFSLENIIYPFLKNWAHSRSKKSIDQCSIDFQSDAIHSKIEIFRDQWGVPHIYADSESDLSYAQGWVTSSERLWQMELSRRLAAGRLSEVFGELALDTDRLVRTVGINRLGENDWNKVPPWLKNFIDSYVNGVNEYIKRCGKTLPVEFKLARFQPEPWDGADVMRIARLIKWQMSHAWFHELVRARLIEEVGFEAAMELDTSYPSDNPIGLPSGIEFNKILSDGKLQAMNGPFINAGGGSNAWAISGSRTRSGKPMLCNDPHLQLTLPAIWFENHLNCPGLHVTGVSIPGIPLVMIGHNESIAWGITLAYTDCEDLFVEKFTDASMTEYEYEGKTRASKIIEEKIHVKGKKVPHIEKVVTTHHGPVISSLTETGKHSLCLNSMSLRESGITEGAYHLNKAKSWDDFVNALAFFNAPQLNIVYADQGGNIGYWVTGEVPVRSRSNGEVPVEGWTGKDEWVDIVPFREMPHAYNPERGYIMSCNHKIVQDDYAHFLGNTWMSGYRAQRLERMLHPLRKVGQQDMIKMQLDLFCVPAAELIGAIENLIEGISEHFEVLEQLKGWEPFLNAGSREALLYELLKSELMKLLLEKIEDKKLRDQLCGEGLHPILVSFNEFYGQDVNIFLGLLQKPGSWWIGDQKGAEKWVTEALRRTKLSADKLEKENGSRTWGEVHQLTFNHAMGERKPMDKLFNIGPFQLGGDADTPAQAGSPGLLNFDEGIVCASYRQIIDLSDWTKCISVLPPGQSGHIASGNYKDQAMLWSTGKYKPMLWARQDVEKQSVKQITIVS